MAEQPAPDDFEFTDKERRCLEAYKEHGSVKKLFADLTDPEDFVIMHRSIMELLRGGELKQSADVTRTLLSMLFEGEEEEQQSVVYNIVLAEGNERENC